MDRPILVRLAATGGTHNHSLRYSLKKASKSSLPSNKISATKSSSTTKRRKK